MKKSLIALAALATVATAAQAQSSVTLYGLIDVGVANVTNTSNTKTMTAMATGGNATSRWGVRGTEDLGGGLKANFVLESQIIPTTGEGGSSVQSGSPAATGTKAATYSGSVATNSLFDRQTTLGLQGSWGRVDLGRQNAIAYDKLVAFDPRSYGNFGGLGSTGINKLSRFDNAIKYYSPNFGGVEFGALYKIGGVAGDTDTGAAYEAYLGYATGSLKLSATHSQLKQLCDNNANNVGGVAMDANYCTGFGGTAGTPGANTFRQTALAGSYVLGAATVKAGYLTRKNPVASATAGAAANNDADLYWGGVSYAVSSNGVLTATYYQVSDKTASASYTRKPTIMTVDYKHSLSKRTSLYGILSRANQDNSSALTVTDNGKVYGGLSNGAGYTPTANKDQTGIMVGVQHSF